MLRSPSIERKVAELQNKIIDLKEICHSQTEAIIALKNQIVFITEELQQQRQEIESTKSSSPRTQKQSSKDRRTASPGLNIFSQSAPSPRGIIPNGLASASTEISPKKLL